MVTPYPSFPFGCVFGACSKQWRQRFGSGELVEQSRNPPCESNEESLTDFPSEKCLFLFGLNYKPRGLDRASGQGWCEDGCSSRGQCNERWCGRTECRRTEQSEWLWHFARFVQIPRIFRVKSVWFCYSQVWLALWDSNEESLTESAVQIQRRIPHGIRFVVCLFIYCIHRQRYTVEASGTNVNTIRPDRLLYWFSAHSAGLPKQWGWSVG